MTVVPLKRRWTASARVPRAAAGRPASRGGPGGAASTGHAKRHRGESQRRPHLTPNADYTGRRARIPRPYCGAPRSRGPSPRSASGTARPAPRGQDLGRGREPEPGRRHKGRRQPRGSGGRSSGLVRCSPAHGAAAWGGGVVLRHLPRAVRQLHHAQPLVVRRCMPPPPHQVACDAARRPAVEQQLHRATSCSPSCPTSDTGPGAGNPPRPLEKGLEAVDVEGPAALPLQRIRRGSKGIGIGVRAGKHGEGARL